MYKGAGRTRSWSAILFACRITSRASIAREEFLPAILYQELDGVRDLQKRAEKEMLAEARQHKTTRILMTCPGMGPIRVAQMLPIVVTPHRFSNKRLLDGGTKPNLAKLSIARQIASIILSMWRSEEVYNQAKLKKMT